MPAEKRRKKGVSSLFTGNPGIYRGDCFGEPGLIRRDDASVRMKKRAVLRTRTGMRRF
jgi:hypothetical protein